MNIYDSHSLVDCTGCGTCFAACPRSSIVMEQNEYGFAIPVVDNDKCINCGICVNVCPDINEEQKYPNKEEGYCLVSHDRNTVNSASGGAFYVFAKYFIEALGGIVYGCELDIETKAVRHIRVEAIEELPRIQGSKYVQSSIIDSYKSISNDLKNKRKVLFSGTPCQVAAIKKLFNTYEDLYTFDLICHGVPSPGFFKSYLQWIEDQYGKISDFKFRNHSTKSIQGYIAFAVCKKGKYRKQAQEDPYYHAFIHELDYRESCYMCRYTSKDRLGDITLGDCNSIAYINPGFSKNQCASFVITNSEKGQILFDNCKKGFDIQVLQIDDEAKYNKRMIEPSKLHREQYDDIMCLYKAGSLFDKYPYFNKKRNNNIKKKIMSLIPEYWVRLFRQKIKS